MQFKWGQKTHATSSVVTQAAPEGKGFLFLMYYNRVQGDVTPRFQEVDERTLQRTFDCISSLQKQPEFANVQIEYRQENLCFKFNEKDYVSESRLYTYYQYRLTSDDKYYIGRKFDERHCMVVVMKTPQQKMIYVGIDDERDIPTEITKELQSLRR